MSIPDETTVLVEPTEEVSPEETTPVEPLPETTPDAEPITPAESEPEEPESLQTYEDVLKHIEKNEEWKAADEARIAEKTKQSFKDGQERIRATLKPMVQEHRDATVRAEATIAAMANTFARAAQDGTLDTNVVKQAWEENRNNLNSLFDSAHRTAKVTSGKDFIAYALGGDVVKGEAGQPVWRVPPEYISLAEKYLGLMDETFIGKFTVQEVAQDFRDDLIEAQIIKAKAPLQAQIKSLQAQLEKGKASTRTGQGVKVAGHSAGSRFGSAEAADAAFNKNEIDAQTWKQETDRLRGRQGA